MRTDFWLATLAGMANAAAVIKRQTTPGTTAVWRPKTNNPEFFSIRVDEACDAGEDPTTTCQFDNYAIRLERGIVIATPYNRWWDPKLPIFFVDDDTQLYTVSLLQSAFSQVLSQNTLITASRSAGSLFSSTLTP